MLFFQQFSFDKGCVQRGGKKEHKDEKQRNKLTPIRAIASIRRRNQAAFQPSFLTTNYRFSDKILDWPVPEKSYFCMGTFNSSSKTWSFHTLCCAACVLNLFNLGSDFYKINLSVPDPWLNVV